MSGLALAIALHKQWPSISTDSPPDLIIYERDDAEDAIGRQGYSLSLRSDPPGGIQALQKLGILDAMVEASVTSVNEQGGGFCMWDKQWQNILKVKSRVPEGLPVGGLRIARKNLRGVLIKAAEQAGCKINWGVGCTVVSKLKDGKMEVHLSNSQTDTCDILIAADGASSKLRAQIRPEDKLQFRNIVAFGGTACFDDAIPPSPVHRDWGILPTGTGVAIFASPVDSHSALWSMSYYTPEPVRAMKAPVSDEDADTLMTEAYKRSVLFPPLLKTLLDKTDRSTLMRFNAQDKAPFAHPPSREVPNVVFVGDANHAVSPFAGNGANMALCDGWDLVEQLGKAGSLEEGVQAYDAIVVPRATKVLKQSHFAIKVAHSGAWPLWFYMWMLRGVKLLLWKWVE
jgi:2-polyprenyl-6-methoxyphenol hydroxylase-like FAD-dependent oxidoreductase